MRSRVQPHENTNSVGVAVAALIGPAFQGLCQRHKGLKESPLDLPQETNPVRAISSFILNYVYMYGSQARNEELEPWMVDFVLRVVHMMWVVDRVHPLYINNVVGAAYGCLILATKLFLDDLRYTTVSMFVRMINWKPIDDKVVRELELVTFTALLRSGLPFACPTRCEANSIRSSPELPKKCTSEKIPAAKRWSSPAFRQVRKSFSRGGKKGQKSLCHRP